MDLMTQAHFKEKKQSSLSIVLIHYYCSRTMNVTGKKSADCVIESIFLTSLNLNVVLVLCLCSMYMYSIVFKYSTLCLNDSYVSGLS